MLPHAGLFAADASRTPLECVCMCARVWKNAYISRSHAHISDNQQRLHIYTSGERSPHNNIEYIEYITTHRNQTHIQETYPRRRGAVSKARCKISLPTTDCRQKIGHSPPYSRTSMQQTHCIHTGRSNHINEHTQSKCIHGKRSDRQKNFSLHILRLRKQTPSSARLSRAWRETCGSVAAPQLRWCTELSESTSLCTRSWMLWRASLPGTIIENMISLR